MSITSRKFDLKRDLRRAQIFLSNTFRMTDTALNWFPDRLENNINKLVENAWVWEDFNEKLSETRIIAMITEEGKLNYFLHVHPDYYYLEQEIIERIEKQVVKTNAKDIEKQTINIFIPEGLEHREKLLERMGYEVQGHHSDIRIRRLDCPLPEIELPKGYSIRGVENTSDFEQIAKLIKIVFGHGDWFTPDLLEEMMGASFYKRDLDLVVVTEDETIVAFCTFRMDPISKITQLEPMGVHPRHRKLGLAKALIIEGIRRSMIYDASLFYIGGAPTSPEAIRLYESTGYNEVLKEYKWSKEI